MPKAHFAKLLLLILLPSSIILVSCGLGGPAGTPTPVPPTLPPTPAGPTALNICAAEEPSSLYLYADNSEAARAIRQAIYDGPFDLQGYEPQAVILESVPRLDTGGAVLQPVTVSAGQLVVDAEGAVRPLQPGVRVRPAGCKDGSCVVEYTGGEMQMDQLVVTFTLKAGLTWSDGTQLTASDSVYSYELSADPATPGDKSKIERTASYVASDERTALWTGLPGYRDPGYQTNFWTPLPRHAWSATPAADLAAADQAARTPLGWGPYMIDEWVAGQRISLSRSANYWRPAEGLPYFNELNFLFVADSAQALQSGECDLALPSETLGAAAEALQQSGAQLHYTPAGSWEHLDFGIQKLAFDDGFNVFNDPPAFFSDVRMRQAVAMCVDRQALINELTWGHGGPPAAYLPPDHPLANAAAASYAFDPAAGNALLDQLGWVTGADGTRVNQTYPGALQGVLLQLSLSIGDTEEDLAITHLIQNSLDDCGMRLEILSAPAEQTFAPGPLGAVFGRAFDLAQFAWPFSEPSSCYLYLGEALPGQDLDTFKYGWGGWNISGWQHAEFDAACQAALVSLPGEAGYGDAERQAQAIFAAELPALPLFVPYELAAARADFCGFSAETGSNLLQGIESYGYAEWCQ
ncbi:MAG: ABC transporter substrate-binding protein [Anaerolineales bacterium]